MNCKLDLNVKNQQLLQEIGINVENREYSKSEIETFTNKIGDYIFSKSTKNGDITKTADRYSDLVNILIQNEK